MNDSTSARSSTSMMTRLCNDLGLLQDNSLLQRILQHTQNTLHITSENMIISFLQEYIYEKDSSRPTTSSNNNTEGASSTDSDNILLLPIILRKYYPLLAGVKNIKIKPLVLINLNMNMEHTMLLEEIEENKKNKQNTKENNTDHNTTDINNKNFIYNTNNNTYNNTNNSSNNNNNDKSHSSINYEMLPMLSPISDRQIKIALLSHEFMIEFCESDIEESNYFSTAGETNINTDIDSNSGITNNSSSGSTKDTDDTAIRNNNSIINNDSNNNSNNITDSNCITSKGLFSKGFLCLLGYEHCLADGKVSGCGSSSTSNVIAVVMH